MAEFSLSDEDVDRIVKRLIEQLPKPMVVPIPPTYIPAPWPPQPRWPKMYEVWCGITISRSDDMTILWNATD